MKLTKLSSKGQIIIPKGIRKSYNWSMGQELLIIDTGDGVLIKGKNVFPKTTIDEVAGALEYKGKAKSLEEMEEGIKKAVEECA